jgi:hypothetical protein
MTDAQLRESVIYNGRRCSRAQWYLLSAAHAILRQGRRIISEQWYFWNLYRSGRGNPAAYPSMAAPHIKHNLAHHADDLGNPWPVSHTYRALGVTAVFNVRGEPWHMDPLYEAQVLHAARTIIARRKPARYPSLRQGSQSTAVTRLQKLLRSLHVKGAPRPTGYYGIATKRAVARFQRKHGLSGDGVVGPKTWAKLRAAST